MFSKFGKERNLFKNDSFRVRYGTVDALKLNAIYVKIDSWVQPLSLGNFDREIRGIRREVILNIKDNLDTDFFSDNFIVDLDLRSSGLMLGKKSFMSIEITVYPKKTHKFKSEEVINKINELSINTINIIKNKDFKFYSKK